MPSGAKPGERRGGRVKGTKNRATLEKELLAARVLAADKAASEVQRTREPGTGIRKLGKEVLDEFMHLFAGMAAYYQPAPPGHPAKPNADEVRFERYATFAVQTAKDLAQYQSPKYSAVMVGHTGPTIIEVEGGLPRGAPKQIEEVAVARHPKDQGQASNVAPRPGSAVGGDAAAPLPGGKVREAVGKD